MATRLGAAIWIDSIPYGWYVFPMTRTTKHSPERGSARTRLLEAARDTIRAKGFAATTVHDLCKVTQIVQHDLPGHRWFLLSFRSGNSTAVHRHP